MRKILSSLIFLHIFFFSFNIVSKEVWVLDNDLSAIKFELPILLINDVKGEFKKIEGLIIRERTYYIFISNRLFIGPLHSD